MNLQRRTLLKHGGAAVFGTEALLYSTSAVESGRTQDENSDATLVTPPDRNGWGTPGGGPDVRARWGAPTNNEYPLVLEEQGEMLVFDDNDVVARALDTSEIRWRATDVGTAWKVRSGDRLCLKDTENDRLSVLDVRDGTIDWQYEVDRNLSTARVRLEADTVVFLEGGDSESPFSGGTRLIALELAGGNVRWERTRDSPGSIWMVADGTVYLSRSVDATERPLDDDSGSNGSGDVERLEARSIDDGSLEWIRDTARGQFFPETETTDPLVVRTVPSDGPDGVQTQYALAPATGDVVWSRTDFETTRTRSELTAFEDLLFYDAGETNRLHVIDLRTGETLFTRDGFREVVAVHNGVAYLGTTEGYVAIDAETGSQQWLYTVDDDTYNNAIVDDGTLFFRIYTDAGPTGTIVTAVDAATGEQEWARTFPYYRGVTFAPNGETLYVNATIEGAKDYYDDSVVYPVADRDLLAALDRETGATSWRFTADSAFWDRAPPTVDGTPYVIATAPPLDGTSTGDSLIYALEESPTPPVPDYGPGDVDRSGSVTLADTRKLRRDAWDWSVDEPFDAALADATLDGERGRSNRNAARAVAVGLSDPGELGVKDAGALSADYADTIGGGAVLKNRGDLGVYREVEVRLATEDGSQSTTVGRTKFALQPGREMVVTGSAERSALSFEPEVCVVDTGDERVTTEITPR